MKDSIVIFWYRRDLRLVDNVGLANALSVGHPVLPIFIFDPEILDPLVDKYDRRVDYIHQALSGINTDLQSYGSRLHTFYSPVIRVFEELQQRYDIQAVYCNRDYEPLAIARDREVAVYLKDHGINFCTFKDQVIFEKSDVLKMDANPYTVYTPYAKKWRSQLDLSMLKEHVMDFKHLYKSEAKEIHSLQSLGFQKTDMIYETPCLELGVIQDYDKYRDYPALQHTTQLGIALRFGTISIRSCVAFALKHNDTWLSELIWREFFMQILYHFPEVVHRSFKPQYDFIAWRNNEEEFEMWCSGNTGYPIVDAGMRQLNQTGFMHNRVRMIVASFLCKHLLIDWRWGEAYFARKLNDYDLSANNGNWQWAAGCGCDAAPYFRIFSPTAQTQKFDKDLKYIKQWNPDYDLRIQQPVVAHEIARDRALKTYKIGLQESS